jgi:SAM-dependent methyltransferase
MTAAGPQQAAQRWAAELDAWRIDPEILASVEENPYTFPPRLFAAREDADAAPSPLADLAREALPPGGSVLDVGAGAGAGSLGLAGLVGHLHAVDAQPSMLAALEESAAARGIELTTYAGRWPDLAPEVPVCDVVLCAHVLYNVPDLAPFVAALTDHARKRVVVEVTGSHPWERLAPMWEAVHHQPRPRGPSAELALEVLRECGIEAEAREVLRPPVVRTGEVYEEWVDFTRRQLCLPPDRRPEVLELLAAHPPGPVRIVTFSWPDSAGQPRA